MVDWKLYEVLYGLNYTDDLCTNGTAYASSFYTGYAPSGAFNDVISTAGDNSWSANVQGAGMIGEWLMYDFGLGNEKAIQKLRIIWQTVDHAQKAFDFEYSDNNIL